MPKGIDLLPAVLPREAPTIEPDLGPPDLDKPYIVIIVQLRLPHI